VLGGHQSRYRLGCKEKNPCIEPPAVQPVNVARNSSVSTVTGLRVGRPRFGTGIFLSSPPRLNRFFYLLSLLSCGYQRLFPWW